MRSRFAFAVLILLGPCLAWCGAVSAVDPDAGRPGPSPLPADSLRVTAHSEGIAAAYREHAPLALFSLGSLAIGGAFYAIAYGAGNPRVAPGPADRAQFTAVVSVAGISALLAAGAYFYYVHRAREREEADRQWDAAVIGGPDGAGGVAVGARLTLALPGGR